MIWQHFFGSWLLVPLPSKFPHLYTWKVIAIFTVKNVLRVFVDSCPNKKILNIRSFSLCMSIALSISRKIFEPNPKKKTQWSSVYNLVRCIFNIAKFLSHTCIYSALQCLQKCKISFEPLCCLFVLSDFCWGEYEFQNPPVRTDLRNSFIFFCGAPPQLYCHTNYNPGRLFTQCRPKLHGLAETHSSN